MQHAYDYAEVEHAFATSKFLGELPGDVTYGVPVSPIGNVFDLGEIIEKYRGFSDEEIESEAADYFRINNLNPDDDLADDEHSYIKERERAFLENRRQISMYEEIDEATGHQHLVKRARRR